MLFVTCFCILSTKKVLPDVKLNGCCVFRQDPAKDLLDRLSFDWWIRSDVFVVPWKYWTLFNLIQISLSKWHVRLSIGKDLSGKNHIIEDCLCISLHLRLCKFIQVVKTKISWLARLVQNITRKFNYVSQCLVISTFKLCLVTYLYRASEIYSLLHIRP